MSLNSREARLRVRLSARYYETSLLYNRQFPSRLARSWRGPEEGPPSPGRCKSNSEHYDYLARDPEQPKYGTPAGSHKTPAISDIPRREIPFPRGSSSGRKFVENARAPRTLLRRRSESKYEGKGDGRPACRCVEHVEQCPDSKVSFNFVISGWRRGGLRHHGLPGRRRSSPEPGAGRERVVADRSYFVGHYVQFKSLTNNFECRGGGWRGPGRSVARGCKAGKPPPRPRSRHS